MAQEARKVRGKKKKKEGKREREEGRKERREGGRKEEGREASNIFTITFTGIKLGTFTYFASFN